MQLGVLWQRKYVASRGVLLNSYASERLCNLYTAPHNPSAAICRVYCLTQGTRTCCTAAIFCAVALRRPCGDLPPQLTFKWFPRVTRVRAIIRQIDAQTLLAAALLVRDNDGNLSILMKGRRQVMDKGQGCIFEIGPLDGAAMTRVAMNIDGKRPHGGVSVGRCLGFHRI